MDACESSFIDPIKKEMENIIHTLMGGLGIDFCAFVWTSDAYIVFHIPSQDKGSHCKDTTNFLWGSGVICRALKQINMG